MCELQDPVFVQIWLSDHWQNHVGIERMIEALEWGGSKGFGVSGRLGVGVRSR